MGEGIPGPALKTMRAWRNGGVFWGVLEGRLFVFAVATTLRADTTFLCLLHLLLPFHLPPGHPSLSFNFLHHIFTSLFLSQVYHLLSSITCRRMWSLGLQGISPVVERDSTYTPRHVTSGGCRGLGGEEFGGLGEPEYDRFVLTFAFDTR